MIVTRLSLASEPEGGVAWPSRFGFVVRDLLFGTPVLTGKYRKRCSAKDIITSSAASYLTTGNVIADFGNSCHCAKHNDAGHDPHIRFTRRVSGRTLTESFRNPTALRKAQQEVAEFHRLQKLSQDLVALNKKICRLRPVAQQRGGWTNRKKNGSAPNPS